MKERKKEVLLRDLCSRLPYRPVCQVSYFINNETTYGDDVPAKEDDVVIAIDAKHFEVLTEYLHDWFEITDVKPYLRPLSDMTEDEYDEYRMFVLGEEDEQIRLCNQLAFYGAHHFDFRGLIEMNIAIAVTPDNNPYNKEM